MIALQDAGTVAREVLSRADRTKLDGGDDRHFYSAPRLVTHVDGEFLRRVTQLYRQRVPDGSAILDLMSSWVSHLPEEAKYARVVGHGMNAAELARNRRLDSFFVRDLNAQPDGWALADCSFDAVLCCVSVQYLQQPERVFAEVFRVLKPGGCCIVTLSNRLYYEKAIRAWRDGSGYARVQLVKQYFLCVRGFTEPEALTDVDVAPPPQGPLAALLSKAKAFLQRSSGDPFYAVVAYRNYRRLPG
ncbi:hypothetical protein WJX81_002517 [Elliptochloris bilobata]|uniref:Methyltransferase type 11 domain-containing protein n=1 Tax=Elliptochloris bilobata TaxID=381761 RepID=A0AAW1RGF9_9CHLO